ncbi:type VI secretion system Vgr family protein [Pedobacter sp. SYP-B3415]|uniref:type VI secretion system Vgr family protein n=1 Tax=Pedobacter sp. SYP-B3415 TaxID=2496641 RepID=UPI00101B636C|nr:phage baseplate assembly protein V [Pedobacter sp. SYP-B3415]
MEEKFHAEISINGTLVPDYDLCVIKQVFNAHHFFEIRLREQADPEQALLQPPPAESFIGKTFNVSFGKAGKPLQLFRGIITAADRQLYGGQYANLRLSGYSPTILMDGSPAFASFNEWSLDKILSQAGSKLASGDLDIVVNLDRPGHTGHQLQYRETDFQFLNRLASFYNEWFYYTGSHLQLGRPDLHEEIKLVYGRNLKYYEQQSAVLPLVSRSSGYPGGKGFLEAADAANRRIEGNTAEKLQDLSASLYPPGIATYPYHANSRSELAEHAASVVSRTGARLLQISAAGDEPGLHLGSIVNIEQSVRLSNNTISHVLGSFFVTAVTHRISGTGKYENEFWGMRADSAVVNGFGATWPRPELELAEVTDNLDPAGMGRVRIRFNWPAVTNDQSDWIRVASPHAGGTGTVQKNRGFVFVPEIGDQVLVAFEGGHIGRPVVLGNLFTGNNAAGGFETNRRKAIATRSGHMIEFDDAEEQPAITISDRNHNFLHIDTRNNHITISAVEDLNLHGKNIHLRATEDFQLLVGRHARTEVGGDQTVHVAAAYKQTAGTYEETVNENKTITVRGEVMESTGSTHHRTLAGDLILQSSGTAQLLGAIDAKVNRS